MAIRWEYRCFPPFVGEGTGDGEGKITQWLATLDALGEQGWEAVGQVDLLDEHTDANVPKPYPQILLKRPKP